MKRREVRAVKFTVIVREDWVKHSVDEIHELLNAEVLYSSNEDPHDLTNEEWKQFAEVCDLAEDDDEG